MTHTTKQTILDNAKHLYATAGYEGFSMRILAKQSGVGLSSIYHFFEDKDVLLRELFKITGTQLGVERAKLPKHTKASDLLRDRILFQFEYIEDVVFVLKYYLHFRQEFLRLDSGYFPSKAYLHIDEVLKKGVESGEFYIEPNQVDNEAKVIAHAINGFLLEYFPDTPKQQELVRVTDSIHRFIMKGLTNKEVPMR